MTQIKQLHGLPYIELTLRAYNVNVPYDLSEDGKTKAYYASFQHPGVTVDNDKGAYIGEMTSQLGTAGVFITPADNHGRWFIPPDDIFLAVLQTLGILEELTNKEPTEEELLAPKTSEEDLEYDEDEYDDVDEEREYEERAEEDDFEDLWEEDWVARENLSKENLEEWDPDDENNLPTPKDYEKHTGLLGGHLEDIPYPHIRKFPNPYSKRQVKVNIVRFVGVGGIHFHVSIKEESNPVWNARHRYWQEAWDDSEGAGLTDSKFHDELYNERAYKDGKFEGYRLRLDVVEAIEAVLVKYFPDHEVDWEDYGGDGFDYYRYKHGE